MSTARQNRMDRYNDAILPNKADDWADAPIEEWTLDEFDGFADLHGSRGAWAASDDFDA